MTQEGSSLADTGSHEVKVFNAIPVGAEGIAIAELTNIVGAEIAKIGQGKAFKNKWIKKDGDKLVRQVRGGYHLFIHSFTRITSNHNVTNQ